MNYLTQKEIDALLEITEENTEPIKDYLNSKDLDFIYDRIEQALKNAKEDNFSLSLKNTNYKGDAFLLDGNFILFTDEFIKMLDYKYNDFLMDFLKDDEYLFFEANSIQKSDLVAFEIKGTYIYVKVSKNLDYKSNFARLKEGKLVGSIENPKVEYDLEVVERMLNLL